jgi:restriction endonuclease S subunit
MGLTPDYKQTDVGMIPDDWQVSTVGDEFSIQLGKMLDSEKNIGIPKPYLGNRAIQWGRIELDDIGIVKMTPSDLRRFRLRNGDLLVCEGGEIGRAAIWKDLIPECYYQKALHRLRPIRGYNVVLMLFMLERWASTGFLANFVTQTSIAHLPKDKFKKIPLPVPSTKAEQEAIAKALSDADALIESLDQLAAKKRDLKQGTMQELLRPKDNWVSKKLQDIAEIRSGGTPSTTQAEFWDGDVLWCTPTDITALKGYKYLTKTRRTITNQGLRCSSAELIPANSIVMTSRATIGECAITQTPVSTNQGFKNFVPFDEIDVDFLYYLLQTKKQDFMSLCGGSTFLEIGKTQLTSFETKLPREKTEQTAIATILSDMDAEIASLETKLVKYRQLKQGMMHNLLTGKTRLVAPALVAVKPATPSREKGSAIATASGVHTWAFNEAVIISVLAEQFGKPEFPLGRKRRTKLSYLFHRKTDQEVQGYLKKAAGPYNPRAKYAGPEKIAQENGYVRNHQSGRFNGFIAGEKIAQARTYFAKWYDPNIIEWLQQFRFKSNDELERLATVDMAMQELLKQNKNADVDSVRALIASEPEWLPKLNRSAFSDVGIAAAIAECHALFG